VSLGMRHEVWSPDSKKREGSLPSFLCAALAFGLLLGGMGDVALPAPAQCPRGTVAVEDMATGAVKCEREDSLESREIPPPRPPAAPPVPEQPASPPAPGTPRAPVQLPAVQADCGLSRWGCEESCDKTYLRQSLAPGSAAAQRAKVALGACLRVCGQEFQCEPRPPETPLR
jgi:hypothetical protein